MPVRAAIDRWRLLRRLLLLVTALSGLAAPATALGEDLGPAPFRCGGGGCYADEPNEMSDTWLGHFELSPKVVNGGEKVTATMTAFYDRVTWDWPWEGCTDNAPTCTFRAPESGTGGWSTVTMYFRSPYGTGVEGDFYAALKQEYGIAGYVRDVAKKGIPGASVSIAGKGGRNVRTNDNGFYHVEVPKGTYTVAASGYCVVHGVACVSRFATVKTPGSRRVDFGLAAPVRISGTIRAKDCQAVANACMQPVPLEGATVTATGIGHAGAGSAVTAADGTYTIEAPAGTYRVTPTLGEGTHFTPSARRVKAEADQTGVDFDACASGPVAKGTFDPCSGLEVAIKATPDPVQVKQDAKGPVPRDVLIAVTVTNTSGEAVDNVTLADELIVGYQGVAKTPELPLRHKGKPAPKRIGTLKPGKKATRQYVYTARGEAELTLQALVSSGPARATRWSLGHGTVTLESPLLVVTTSFPKSLRVRSPESAKLIKAGTNFAIRVKLENRSFTKPLFVQPRGFSVRGNAHGGKWQVSDLPIQPALAGSGDVAECTCHEVIRLAPNTEQEWDVVFGTWANDSRAREVAPGRRGTRAELRLLDFDVWLDPEDDTVEPTAVAPKLIQIDRETRSHTISIDDSTAEKPPFNGAAAAVYFTAGAFQGAWDWTAGTVRGVVVDLPVMIGQGLLGLPTAAQKYTQLQVELWESLEGADKVDFFNVVRNHYLLAYKNAPALRTKAEEAWGGVNDSIELKYRRMFEEWYDGDWTVAATQFGNEGAQRFLDVATAVAPCVLTRFPKAVEAMKATRAAAYEQITASLASASTRLRASDALRVLGQIGRVGYELSPALLKQVYGMTQRQIDDLIRISKQHGVLFTARSRGYESLRWGENAFFKPEQIKIKTVNWIDVEFLDYGDDIGRLVVKRPISPRDVKRRLEVAGINPTSPRGREILARHDLRMKEWSSNDYGMAKQLRRDAPARQGGRQGELQLEFNWRENLVDPSLAPAEQWRVNYRMEPSKRFRNGREVVIQDEWVLKVDHTGTGVFENVIGDIDLVAITDLAGRALSDLKHMQVIDALRASSLQSPHMDSGSWMRDGKFWFKAKERELTRRNEITGEPLLDVQLGPDGKARAVVFDLAKSQVTGPNIDQSNYRLIFRGMLVHPSTN